MMGLVESLCDSLRATRELCGRLDRTAWEEPAPGLPNSTPGRHVRHILDHVRALLDAIEHATPLRYYQRERGGLVERAPENAIAVIDQLLARLTARPPELERALVVCDQIEDREYETASTVARELLFVSSHTSHHHAFLRLQLSRRFTFDERFGLARETPIAS